MKMKESQFLLIKEQLKKLTAKECFYKHKLEGVNVNQIQSQEDFEKLPFTWKGDLRGSVSSGPDGCSGREKSCVFILPQAPPEHRSSFPIPRRMWMTGL